MTDKNTVFDAAFEYQMNGMSEENARVAASEDETKDARIAELENALAAASGTIAAMRADRLADLPDMIAPLVWDYRGNVSCTAHTPFGKYLVETCHEDGYGMWTPRDDTEDDPTFGYHDDIHKGIDAANAHYADAIISEMRKPHGVSP